MNIGHEKLKSVLEPKQGGVIGRSGDRFDTMARRPVRVAVRIEGFDLDQQLKRHQAKAARKKQAAKDAAVRDTPLSPPTIDPAQVTLGTLPAADSMASGEFSMEL